MSEARVCRGAEGLSAGSPALSQPGVAMSQAGRPAQNLGTGCLWDEGGERWPRIVQETMPRKQDPPLLVKDPEVGVKRPSPGPGWL